MKKKLICGALAFLMAFGTVFPLTACKEKTQGDLSGNNSGNGGNQQGGNQQGGNQQGGNQQGGNQQGGNQQGGNQQGGNQQGGNQNEEQVIAPGTVITDEALKGEIMTSLSQSELGGFTYSASANIQIKAGEAAQTQKIAAEGSVLLSESISADVYAYLQNAGGEEETTQYLMLFVRDGYSYSVQGDWNDEGEVDFSSLKEQLKAKTDPLVFNREELSGTLSAALNQPAIVKMIKNLPSLSEGKLIKTEGGFHLEFDLIEAVNGLLDGFATVAEAVDKKADLTLGGLITQTFFKSTLEKLLNGVTAEELRAALTEILPEKISSSLPQATKSATGISYAEGLLRSGSFYESVTGENESWNEFKTFSEVPFNTLIEIISGGEFDLDGKTYKQYITDFKEKLESEIVSLLMGFIELDNGELSDESFELTFAFSFGDDKKLLGFSVDGVAEGASTASQQPEEGGNGQDSEGSGSGQTPEAGGDGQDSEGSGSGQTPEEGGQDSEGSGSGQTPEEGGNGQDSEGSSGNNSQQGSDQGQSGGDGGMSEQEKEAKQRAQGEEPQKTTARGTVKLEAACASAPEMFSLAGCKYYTQEGEKATIPAQK